MDNLKELEFSEADFKLLFDGLEALPFKDSGAEIMATLIGGAMIKDPEAQRKFQREQDQAHSLKTRKRDALLEDVRVLQSKVIRLKRYMIEKGLMAELGEMLGNTGTGGENPDRT